MGRRNERLGCGGILPEAHQRDIGSPVRSRHGGAKALEAIAQLASYNAYLRHVLANQQKLRRDSEYDRSDWPNTVKALSNGPPAMWPTFMHCCWINSTIFASGSRGKTLTSTGGFGIVTAMLGTAAAAAKKKNKKRAAAKKTHKRKGVTAAARKAA